MAALVLARAGARVLLLDRLRFPRDKACGDLLGPRAVGALQELGVTLRGARRAEHIVLLGPSNRRALLPWPAGRSYPGYALVVPRARLDAVLRAAALEAGAKELRARVVGLALDHRDVRGVLLSDGTAVHSDFVLGADGALSAVAAAAGLVRPGEVLWGLALRCYLEAEVEQPAIVLWEPSRRRAFPGYGWLFPGPDGRANLGLGAGVVANRSLGRRVRVLLPRFVEELRRRGLLTASRIEPSDRRGAWLKLGMVGTTPAYGRIMLIGDAAGLVNPLQGEGIAEAMLSGRAAAEAILRRDGAAAREYLAFLAASFGRFQSSNAALHAALVTRPRALSAASRLLTAPGAARFLSGAWAIYWNDLLAGAAPGRARAAAQMIAAGSRLATARSSIRRGVGDALARTA